MRSAIALVDYDNIRQSKEEKASDVAINLAVMIPRLSERIESVVPGIDEIRFRLYGGWSQRNGHTTFQCGWLLGEIPKYNTRYGRVRARCSLAMELVARADLQLIGTYRDKAQKMVDGMIISDLIYLSFTTNDIAVLVSNDDDFVPGVISGSCARKKNSPLYYLRPERKDPPLNDHLLRICGVEISNI